MKRRHSIDISPRPVKKRILRLKRRRLPIAPSELCPPTADALDSPAASSHPTGKAWRLRSVSAPAKLFTKWIVNPIPVVNLDATKCDVKFADASTAPQFGEGMRELKDSDDMQVQEVDAKDSAAMNQWDARVVLLVCVIYTYVAIFFLTIAYALAVLLSHCLGSSHTTPSADQVLPRASGSETGIEKMAAIWGDPIGPVDEVEEVKARPRTTWMPRRSSSRVTSWFKTAWAFRT